MRSLGCRAVRVGAVRSEPEIGGVDGSLVRSVSLDQCALVPVTAGRPPVLAGEVATFVATWRFVGDRRSGWFALVEGARLELSQAGRGRAHRSPIAARGVGELYSFN